MTEIRNPAAPGNAPTIPNGNVTFPFGAPLDHPALRDLQAVTNGRITSLTGATINPDFTPSPARRR